MGMFPTRPQPQRNPQRRCDIRPCAQPTIRSIIVPGEDSDAAISASTLADKNQPQVSCFLDFAHKIFVMNILRGILPLAPGKSLILDILGNRGGRGEGN